MAGCVKSTPALVHVAEELWRVELFIVDTMLQYSLPHSLHPCMRIETERGTIKLTWKGKTGHVMIAASLDSRITTVSQSKKPSSRLSRKSGTSSLS